MKHIFLILLCILFPFTSFAEERWHMVSFGRDGFGLSGAHEDINTRSGSPFQSEIYYFSDIGLNYAYRVSSRVQIGAKYQNIHREYRLRSNAGGLSSVEIEVQHVGAFALYNFSEDLNDAWFAGYGYTVI
jgi:hypothetical protein